MSTSKGAAPTGVVPPFPKVTFGFEAVHPDDRSAIKRKFLSETGKLLDDVEILYTCEKGFVVRRDNVRVTIWSSGRCYVEILG